MATTTQGCKPITSDSENTTETSLFIINEEHTLIPVLVASREASSSGSNIGLNATVKAQSTMYPAKERRKKTNITSQQM